MKLRRTALVSVVKKTMTAGPIGIYAVCLDDRLKEFIRDGGQVPGEEMLTEGQQSLGSAA